jgi:phosphatidylglycerol:prolipoprotein diacylglycerol transferase
VEFIRRNPHVLCGMSNAQLASVGSMVVGLVVMWIVAKRTKPEPEEPAEMAKAA